MADYDREERVQIAKQALDALRQHLTQKQVEMLNGVIEQSTSGQASAADLQHVLQGLKAAPDLQEQVKGLLAAGDAAQAQALTARLLAQLNPDQGAALMDLLRQAGIPFPGNPAKG